MRAERTNTKAEAGLKAYQIAATLERYEFVRDREMVAGKIESLAGARPGARADRAVRPTFSLVHSGKRPDALDGLAEDPAQVVGVQEFHLVANHAEGPA